VDKQSLGRISGKTKRLH